MIEDIKYATISKIYVKDLVCFNNTNSKNLKTFCLENGITYLPSLDKKSCFRLNGDKFVNSKLTNDLICNAYDRLFDETTIAKFESGKHDEVMFVVEDNKIKGVVHLVDYNSAFINFEFYKAIYELETNLRQILIKAGETNDTLLKWFLLESKKNQHWKRRYTQCVPNDKK